MTCKKFGDLLSKTTAFLHRQTAQHKAAAPTNTRCLKFCATKFSQPLNILDTLDGLGNPHAA
jgi:hypothetical protein